MSSYGNKCANDGLASEAAEVLRGAETNRMDRGRSATGVINSYAGRAQCRAVHPVASRTAERYNWLILWHCRFRWQDALADGSVMANKITFYVTNDVPATTADHVLVFIKPVPTSDKYQYYAWRDLNPSPGSTASFKYATDVSVDVLDPATGSLSAQKDILKKQRFSAINPNGQSPYIDGVDINDIESGQRAILNSCTTPATSIVLNWYNMGKMVVSMGYTPPGSINVGKTTIYETEPALYFLAANPELIGPDYGLYVFADSTPYTAPAGTETVNVRWYRESPSGPDLFEFTPSSAASVSADSSASGANKAIGELPEMRM